MRSRYRADIDGLRAISVLAVVLFHADLGLPGGFVGVDVFFVISGFLITGLIRDGLEAGSFSLSDFWERRIRRIWPAALVTTAAVLCVGWVVMLPRDYRVLGGDAIAQLMLVANVRFWLGTDYFDSGSDLRPLLHMWSLAVEEQFYVVYPIVLLVLWRYARPWMFLTLAGATVASLVASAVTLATAPSACFYLLPCRAWELQLGGLLALMPSRPRLGLVIGDLLAAVGLAAIAACCFMYGRSTAFPGMAALPVCGGSILVILGSENRQGLVSRALAWAPFRRLGLMSYSLYLCHWPIFAFMRYRWGEHLPVSLAMIGVASSVTIAALSYRWLETPMRLGLSSWRLRQVALMAVLLSLPILVFAGWIRQTGGAPHRVDPSVVRFHAQQELPRQWDLGVAGGSGRSLPIGAMRKGSECPCFLLLGDSHGMAISQVIDDAARHRGISGEASLRGAFVPLIGVWRSGSRSASTDWREHEEFDAWLNELVHRCKPRHIILCARWSAYLADEKTDSGFGDSFGIAPRAGQGMEAGSRSALMRQSLGIVLDLAERQDAQLWVLLEVPRQDITPQRRAIVGMAQGMIPLDGISSTAHEARVAEVRTVVESLKSDRLHVVDLSGPFFGSDGRSRTGRGGVSWYMDDDHISASGALELLSPMLDSVFERISEDCPNLQPGIPESD